MSKTKTKRNVDEMLPEIIGTGPPQHDSTVGISYSCASEMGGRQVLIFQERIPTRNAIIKGSPGKIV